MTVEGDGQITGGKLKKTINTRTHNESHFAVHRHLFVQVEYFGFETIMIHLSQFIYSSETL